MTAYGGRELAAAFRTVRGNTVKTVEDIPEGRLGVSAGAGTRTIAQMIAHIAYNSRVAEDMHRVKKITGFDGYNFPALIAVISADEAKLSGKDQLIAALKSEGEHFASWLESLSDEFLAERVENFDKSGSRSRLEMLLSPKEHEMHHRAQLMVLQRIVGVVPHLTRERLARTAAAQAAAQPKA
ncbi:MAG: DinB family protein [Gemmatimonadetes bacterium]|nr:DinB family protein [Gemmatimonadota bacterium]